MSVVAYQDLGELGVGESVPTVIPWRWYYHSPNLPLWLLLAAALVLPRANRRPQAWAILVPLLVLTVFVGPMVARLFSFPDSATEVVCTLLATLTIGWGSVWLTAPWLARRHGFVAFLSALGIMALVGGLAYVGNLRFDYTRDALFTTTVYAMVAVALVVGMTISGLCCGGVYRPGRFLAWLFLWTVLTTAASMVVLVAVMSVVDSMTLNAVLTALLECQVIAVILGILVYLGNLPFMILARKSPCYRERFKQVFRMEDVHRLVFRMNDLYDPAAEPGSPFRPDSPESTKPTERAVTIQDVVGRWQFYLDGLGAAVIVEFRPDGTFSQRITANQGGVKEHSGGTWSLETPWVHLTDYITARDETRQSPTWWMIDVPSGVTLFGGDGCEREGYLRMMRARGPK